MDKVGGNGMAPVEVEERKVVTVLFCDLVEFTARSDAADPEDVRATIAPYHALLRAEIERFDGTIEKFIGDAVMAVFGAPVSHEDDPERAVRAALRILEAIDELNDQRPGLDLAVRIGINTGEAIVVLGALPERGEGMVTGDVVNTASRLQSTAPVGGVVAGEATYQATRGIFQYEELPAATLKGKADPVPLWRALAPISRLGMDITRTRTTPMVGRDLEMTLLRGTFERSVHDRSVHLVTIVGEPGVGKSRLVAELFSYVDSLKDLVTWRQGRCLPYGEGITFWALGQIAKAQAGILESDPPEVAEAKLVESLRALVQDEGEQAWLRARVGPLVGLSASATGDRVETFTAWRRYLEAIAATDPAVIVVEDLHWADEAMLEFTKHLTEYSVGVPLLIVATARPELYERDRTWGAGIRNASVIDLGPLTEEAIAGLVSSLLNRSVLPADTQALLLERAEGNPLYAEEFVRMLTDRGFLDDLGNVSVEPSEIPFPDSVQALIAARLDTLPPERKALLQDAAVVGKTFWSGAVADMGGRDEEIVREDLHGLARKELIRPIRHSSVRDQAEYSFWHLLIRDVAYGQIPRGRRAAKHRSAAAWIERLAGDRLADLAEVIAFHVGQALALSRAAGLTDEIEELEGSARRYLVMAGERALALDVVAAERHLRSALDVVPLEHPERPGILAKLADATAQSGRLEEADSLYEEAVEGLHRLSLAREAAEATVGWARVARFRGDPVRRRRLLDEATRGLEAFGPSASLVQALREAGGDLLWSGHYGHAVAAAERLLAMAQEVGAEEGVVRALGLRGTARAGLGDPGGLEDVRDALREAIRLGLGSTTAELYADLGGSLYTWEGPSAALAVIREAISFAQSRGLGEVALWMRIAEVQQLSFLGRWDEVIRLSDGIADEARSRGAGTHELYAYSLSAPVRAQIGFEVPPDVVARVRQAEDTQLLVPVLLARVIASCAGRALSVALELVQEVLSLTAHGPDQRVEYLPDLVRAAVAGRDLQLGERLLEGMDLPALWYQHASAASRAALAEARGEMEEAAHLYTEAAEGWTSFGHRFELGQARFGRGRCLLALGRPQEAVEDLSQARDVFFELGAQPAVAEVDGWLERAALTL
jgi:class 3 adenylate cyclase/tetratricopeptide (TPR) repeat protein